MPSDSNMSHDLYIIDQSCVAHLHVSFRGGGLNPLAKKLGPISIPKGSLGGMFFKYTYTVVRM